MRSMVGVLVRQVSSEMRDHVSVPVCSSVPDLQSCLVLPFSRLTQMRATASSSSIVQVAAAASAAEAR
jgi:hypothetical protein